MDDATISICFQVEHECLRGTNSFDLSRGLEVAEIVDTKRNLEIIPSLSFFCTYSELPVIFAQVTATFNNLIQVDTFVVYKVTVASTNEHNCRD